LGAGHWFETEKSRENFTLMFSGSLVRILLINKDFEKKEFDMFHSKVSRLFKQFEFIVSYTEDTIEFDSLCCCLFIQKSANPQVEQIYQNTIHKILQISNDLELVINSTELIQITKDNMEIELKQFFDNLLPEILKIINIKLGIHQKTDQINLFKTFKFMGDSNLLLQQYDEAIQFYDQAIQGLEPDVFLCSTLYSKMICQLLKLARNQHNSGKPEVILKPLPTYKEIFTLSLKSNELAEFLLEIPPKLYEISKIYSTLTYNQYLHKHSTLLTNHLRFLCEANNNNFLIQKYDFYSIRKKKIEPTVDSPQKQIATMVKQVMKEKEEYYTYNPNLEMLQIIQIISNNLSIDDFEPFWKPNLISNLIKICTENNFTRKKVFLMYRLLLILEDLDKDIHDQDYLKLMKSMTDNLKNPTLKLQMYKKLINTCLITKDYENFIINTRMMIIEFYPILNGIERREYLGMFVESFRSNPIQIELIQIESLKLNQSDEFVTTYRKEKSNFLYSPFDLKQKNIYSLGDLIDVDVVLVNPFGVLVSVFVSVVTKGGIALKTRMNLVQGRNEIRLGLTPVEAECLIEGVRMEAFVDEILETEKIKIPVQKQQPLMKIVGDNISNGCISIYSNESFQLLVQVENVGNVDVEFTKVEILEQGGEKHLVESCQNIKTGSQMVIKADVYGKLNLCGVTVLITYGVNDGFTRVVSRRFLVNVEKVLEIKDLDMFVSKTNNYAHSKIFTKSFSPGFLLTFNLVNLLPEPVEILFENTESVGTIIYDKKRYVVLI
jgi:tetratricopeptide (TPR) repeat protein